jgi:hypothetical protein
MIIVNQNSIDVTCILGGALWLGVGGGGGEVMSP